MSIHQETLFQKALDAIESLPIDAREEIIEIIRRRLAEDRREEIAANAREAVMAVREKRATYGTVEDLKRDLTQTFQS
jgi:predicted AAA+ superfamily ATPase